MCLNWIESNQTLQWLGLAFNTFVHVIMYAAQSFVLAALCSLFATLTCARHISPLNSRYAYYAFTVYSPAPRPLKMLITQVRRHSPHTLSREFCICCLLPVLRFK